MKQNINLINKDEIIWMFIESCYRIMKEFSHVGNNLLPVDIGVEGTTHIALRGEGVVEEPDFEGHDPLGAEVDALHQFAGSPREHVQVGAILAWKRGQSYINLNSTASSLNLINPTLPNGNICSLIVKISI